MKIRREVVAIAASVTLFVISLTQPAICSGAICAPQGWILLLFGWLDLGSFGVNWLANPALLLGYGFMLRKKYGSARVASYLSVILAASFLARRTVTADGPSHITGYAIGYWLWLASTVVMALSSSYLIYASELEASLSRDNPSVKSE